jgi:hypothetical protein
MKITIIGDSIREQYTNRVKELLGEGFEIWSPSENCRFAKYTYRGLFDWTRYMEGSDIIHFNIGLWDACNLFGDGSFSSDEEYVRDVMRVVDMMKRRYGSTIIFATTTPALGSNKFYDKGIVEHFNSLITPRLIECGVIINDLYSVIAKSAEENIRDDGVHLSEIGIERAAQHIADFIREVAAKIESCTSSDSPISEDTTGAPVLI